MFVIIMLYRHIPIIVNRHNSNNLNIYCILYSCNSWNRLHTILGLPAAAPSSAQPSPEIHAFHARIACRPKGSLPCPAENPRGGPACPRHDCRAEPTLSADPISILRAAPAASATHAIDHLILPLPPEFCLGRLRRRAPDRGRRLRRRQG